MGKNISYVLVTPYTVAKSRTGGIIARLLSQLTDAELVAAQMIAPDLEFVKNYTLALREQARPHPSFLADYFEKKLTPSPETGAYRALLLIFKGEDVCKSLSRVCGHLYPEHRAIDEPEGETIRDTYADLIVCERDNTKFDFFEPAVLSPRTQDEADTHIKLFVDLLKKSKNIIESRYPDGTKPERTLIIIKPENWRFASARPGEILDMFSQTGLRIIGIKIMSFTLEQALEFYGPVEAVLKDKLSPVFGKKARECLEKEFQIKLPDYVGQALADSFGVYYAKDQFYQIVEFMSGQRPDITENRPVKCMIVVYEGENAVQKIRNILGPTDPAKAPGGTIRREFGSNVMVNAAHASDSAESFEREKAIVAIEKNDSLKILEDYITAVSAS